MIQELPHQTFGFQIGDISFFLKLYAIKDDFQKVFPKVDLRIVQDDKIENATGFRLKHLVFLSSTYLKTIKTLFSGYYKESEDNGYNMVCIEKLEVDYYLIGKYHLNFLINDEYEFSGLQVKYQDNVLFSSESRKINLQHFIESIDMINQGIAEFIRSNNFTDKFFEKYSYNERDPYHKALS